LDYGVFMINDTMNWIIINMKYISIPITCAFVGWLTNYIAVKMIFHPAEFIGVGKLGWKGIIPNHAIKMSGLIARILTERLVKPHELYSRIKPEDINLLIEDIIAKKSEEIVEEIIKNESPILWGMLTAKMKKALAQEVKQSVPAQIVAIYNSFGDELDQVLEFEEIIKSSLSGKNTSILIEMFQRCGGPEFHFIIVSGIYFGTLIGFFQLLFINILGQWWTMPIMGVLVGYITNWIALQMIFKPLEEKKFGFLKYQGLFLKRQDAVSFEFAGVVSKNVLNTSNLIKLIFNGKGGDLIMNLVMKRANIMVSETLKEKSPLAPVLIGSDKIRSIKETVSAKILLSLPEIVQRIQNYISDSMQIQPTIYARLKVLPKAEFEELLHSVFKEDEMTLILLGALLGGLVGLIQAYMVF
jgi:uncharacterized membrane protein YheB (UPF0754 family)